MELSVKNVVVFRGGGVGIVTNWGDKVAYVVGARFTNPTNRWNDKGHYGNKGGASSYDIIAVYDGSTIEDPIKVFRASFKIGELPPLWAEEITE